ncbi:MAG: Fur family transcriptional regulator [Planctomycetota bacterium]|jgi:Fur family ferric uptake transcriptional regulator
MTPAISGKARDLLKNVGLRQTVPRQVVLSVLLKATAPVTHEQITAELAAGAPNKVTIYRVLESFIEAGIVHKAFLKERTWHFELADNCTEDQCHPHFTCRSCEATHCFTDADLPITESPRGFTVLHQRVQLEGLCPKCST